MLTLIIAPARSGTTLLCAALAQHPKVKTFKGTNNYEPFAPPVKLHDTKKIVERYNVIKILHSQLKFDYDLSSLIFLKNKKPNVIFLNRNLFDCFLSLKLAQSSSIWHSKSKIHSEELIYLDPVALKKFFAFHTNKGLLWKCLFHESPSLEIEYKDMIGNWDETITEIEDFMGIERMKLKKVYERTNAQGRKAAVNYIDLVNEFKNTHFSKYFEHSE